MSHPYMNEDVVMACVDLIGRCGAKGFELGYVRDNVPVEDAGWYASASYQGARVTSEEHRSPSAAALGLAERLLAGGRCRCRETVTLSDSQAGCRWRLVGARWEPGCDAPPIRVDAQRGDLAAMQRAIGQPMNRAERRRLDRARGDTNA